MAGMEQWSNQLQQWIHQAKHWINQRTVPELCIAIALFLTVAFRVFTVKKSSDARGVKLHVQAIKGDGDQAIINEDAVEVGNENKELRVAKVQSIGGSGSMFTINKKPIRVGNNDEQKKIDSKIEDPVTGLKFHARNKKSIG